MTRIRFNRQAALLGAFTAYLAAEAYGLAFAKTCDSHFNLSLMFGWLFVSNFFMWIWWIPLTLICAALFGLLVVSETKKTYRILAWALLVVPVGVFFTAFILTPYGSAGRCVI